MSKPNNMPKKNHGLSKKLLIIFVSICLFVLFCDTIAYFGRKQQAKVTSGAEKYTGVRYEVAKKAVEYTYSLDRGSILLDNNMVVHVEDVRPATTDEIGNCQTRGKYSSDPDDPKHYTVVVSHRTYFGIKDSTEAIPGCIQQLNH